MPDRNREGGGVVVAHSAFERMRKRTTTVEDGHTAPVVDLELPREESGPSDLDRANLFLERWRQGFRDMILPGGFKGEVVDTTEDDCVVSVDYTAKRPAAETHGESDAVTYSTTPHSPSPLLRKLLSEDFHPGRLVMDIKSPAIKDRFIGLLIDELAGLAEDLQAVALSEDEPEEDDPIRMIVPRAAARTLLQFEASVQNKSLDNDKGAFQVLLSNYDYDELPLRVEGFVSLSLFLGPHTVVVFHPSEASVQVAFVQDDEHSPAFFIDDERTCSSFYNLIMGELESVWTGWETA